MIGPDRTVGQGGPGEIPRLTVLSRLPGGGPLTPCCPRGRPASILVVARPADARRVAKEVRDAQTQALAGKGLKPSPAGAGGRGGVPPAAGLGAGPPGPGRPAEGPDRGPACPPSGERLPPPGGGAALPPAPRGRPVPREPPSRPAPCPSRMLHIKNGWWDT